MFSILQAPSFKRRIKKLHPNQKKDLYKVIRTVSEDPFVGEKKKNDISDVYVYKFRMCRQLCLLAYSVAVERTEIYLLDLGSHENFYRDLKNRLD